jgi:hypothetical protein
MPYFTKQNFDLPILSFSITDSKVKGEESSLWQEHPKKSNAPIFR